MPGFRTYLFDLDGTLIDSIDLILRAYRHTAERHLSTSPPDSVWRQGLGTPLRQQLSAVTEDPELVEAMVATYREYHFAHHDSSIKAYPQVVEVVRALAGRGVRLGVVTSKLRMGAERGLVATGLMEFFHAVISADEVTRHKPHPEPVHAALVRLGAEAREAVFIGDSPHDIAAGRDAGVATAGVLWGPFPREELTLASADFLLERPSEILFL
ncbi:MAG TPA: HAD-IA family hydrolase [Vicinamibacteria bacterium]|jgi:pyrophosphatase PpaX